MSTIYFVTHPEVNIDPETPVTNWSLSEVGISRIHKLLTLNWVQTIGSVYSSTEKKAVEGAELLGAHIGKPVHTLEPLGENDRSATGYLPSSEFEAMADQFFANPESSIQGWESAAAAQLRIVNAMKKIIAIEGHKLPIAVVSHGAVGTLLLCSLNSWDISRKHDQPGGGGGNYFSYESDTEVVNHGWRAIDS